MHVGQGWICWQQSNVYGCLSKHGAGTINTHYLQSCTRVHCICRLTTDEPGSGERPASKCLTTLVSMLLPCRNALWTNWSQSILVSWKPVVVAHPPSILLHCVMACVRSVSVQIIQRHRERYICSCLCNFRLSANNCFQFSSEKSNVGALKRKWHTKNKTRWSVFIYPVFYKAGVHEVSGVVRGDRRILGWLNIWH